MPYSGFTSVLGGTEPRGTPHVSEGPETEKAVAHEELLDSVQEETQEGSWLH